MGRSGRHEVTKSIKGIASMPLDFIFSAWTCLGVIRPQACLSAAQTADPWHRMGRLTCASGESATCAYYAFSSSTCAIYDLREDGQRVTVQAKVTNCLGLKD